MSPTEQMLRAAFTWSMFHASEGLIKYGGPFVFVATGRVQIGDRTIDCPHLRWGAPGRIVTVSVSPAGRVLHYVDTYVDHSFRLEMKLPREFWAEATP